MSDILQNPWAIAFGITYLLPTLTAYMICLASGASLSFAAVAAVCWPLGCFQMIFMSIDEIREQDARHNDKTE